MARKRTVSTERQERAAAKAAAKLKLAEAKQERTALKKQLFHLRHKIVWLQRDVNSFRPERLVDAYGFSAKQRLVGTDDEAAAYRANRWMMG